VSVERHWSQVPDEVRTSMAMFDLIARKLCIITRSELGAVTPRVPWFGGTGFVSGAPQGWFKPRLRPKDFV
jgi:hypothetical protein